MFTIVHFLCYLLQLINYGNCYCLNCLFFNYVSNVTIGQSSGSKLTEIGMSKLQQVVTVVYPQYCNWEPIDLFKHSYPE